MENKFKIMKFLKLTLAGPYGEKLNEFIYIDLNEVSYFKEITIFNEEKKPIQIRVVHTKNNEQLHVADLVRQNEGYLYIGDNKPIFIDWQKFFHSHLNNNYNPYVGQFSKEGY